ncbi:contact-dependent growth inhibition system immunity protein [Streptomyces sp. NPDC002402]
MTEKRSAYLELGYSEDFGLTGLTERLCSLGRRSDRTGALDAVAQLADQSDGEEAVELGEDARRLLASSLPDAILHAVWLAAVGQCFNPADHGMNSRVWLEKISELSTDRIRRDKRSYVPPPVQPVRDEELRRAVAAEIRNLAPALDRADAPSDLVDCLEQVVTRADADLGFRLFLRALKVYSIRIEKERYDRLLGLGERFGFSAAVVHDGLNVIWPPVDTTRRDATWDFGLSGLTALFVAGWHTRGARETVRYAAAGDGPERTPGSEAAILLEDTLRLLESDLSTDTITTLWLAATARGFNIDHFAIEGRDWLRQIVEVCEERLRDVAPSYTPIVPTAWTELTEEVLRELREVMLLCADKAVSPDWRPIPATTVLASLEQAITRVDPDLGFRLFLRLLVVLSVPLTEEQYARYETIGARFGYGECHVFQVEDLIRHG